MPVHSFLRQPNELLLRGPIIRASLHHPQVLIDILIKAGRQVPSAIPVRALIDTGAGVSVIKPSLATTLGLLQIGTTTVHSASHPSSAPIYAAALSFPELNLRPVDPLRVAALDLPGQDGIDMLIGREVMSRWLFIYTGFIAQYTLAD